MSTNLLETPMSPSKLDSLHVVLMVDLSEPHQLWFTLKTMMVALKIQLQHSLEKFPDGNLERKLRDKMSAVKRVDREMHPDVDKVNPFLLPLVILGGRYDEFQNLDPEKKKTVCRAIRFFAHHHGATLQFYSAKDVGLAKKARDLLSHHAFGTEPVKGVSQDYNKPLIISAWSDSFEAISGSSMSGDGCQNLELWKHQFVSHFPESVSRPIY